MADKKIIILYVDDEEYNLFAFKATFRTKYQVLTAISGDEAFKVLDKQPVHIIIADQRMPDMTGVALLEKITEKYPDPMRILLTGYADMSIITDAIKKGKFFNYHTKPWNVKELTTIIDQAYNAYLNNLN